MLLRFLNLLQIDRNSQRDDFLHLSFKSYRSAHWDWSALRFIIETQSPELFLRFDQVSVLLQQDSTLRPRPPSHPFIDTASDSKTSASRDRLSVDNSGELNSIQHRTERSSSLVDGTLRGSTPSLRHPMPATDQQ